jgi:hypothetical protein
MQLQTSIILLFFILIVTRPGVAFSRGDSFDAVFEELLKEYRDDVSNPQTFPLLRRKGSGNDS